MRPRTIPSLPRSEALSLWGYNYSQQLTLAVTSSVSFAEPQAFKPPSGFKSAKKQSSSSNVSSLLSNLRGKQVFHITAPSFLPLSKVKEVSLAKVMQGEPVLKHDGVNYGIPMDSISQGETDGQTLLLHDPKSQSYYNTPTNNIPSYHVQEMISLPEDNGTGSIKADDYEKPARKQPKHLKMRFHPVGSGNAPAETIGSSSEESDGEEKKPTFKVPKGSSSQEKEERKRKHHHTEGEGNQPNGSVPRKKSKKHSETGGDDSSKMDIDEKKSKKSSKSKDEKKRKKAEKA